jgi:serine/threonine protein kinase
MKCPNCFVSATEAGTCGSCGFDRTDSGRDRRALASGHILQEKYYIGRVLGAGGFGITYLALDVKLNRRVALKEYLPNELAARARDGITMFCHSSTDEGPFRLGLRRFFVEGEMIARFDHPNIVRAYEVFEANGTAYLAMEFLEGKTLRTLLNERGVFSEAQAVDLMTFILDALKVIHNKNVVHRDMKPDNVYLTTEGRTLLLDFGGAKDIVGEHSQSLMAVFSQGYAAPEQYHGNDAKAGTWTDVYGTAALLYKLLTGITPQSALERYGDDKPLDWTNCQVSAVTRRAIAHAMMIRVEDRTANVDEFQKELAGAIQHSIASKTRTHSSKPIVAVASIALLAATAFVAVRHYFPSATEIPKEVPATALTVKIPEGLPIKALPEKISEPKIDEQTTNRLIPPPKGDSDKAIRSAGKKAPVSGTSVEQSENSDSRKQAQQREAQFSVEQKLKEDSMIYEILNEGENCFAAKKFECSISSANAALRIRDSDQRAIALKERARAGQTQALEGITIR